MEKQRSLSKQLCVQSNGDDMKIFINVILTILVFLAVSAGITKIILMPQDVEFFGEYGFTNPILIAYGVVQLLGGVLLALPKTRIIGAVLVAITFLISAVILVMSGNIPVTIITLIFAALLVFIIKQSLNEKNQ